MAQRKFLETWVTNLVDSVDAHLDRATRTSLMEFCGRACAQRGAVESAKQCHGDIENLVSTLDKWIGKGNAHRDGSLVHLVYPKCFCHLVAKGQERLPDTYCLCSRGWLKEVFETVLNHPVEVELLESVKRGAGGCSFAVML